MLNGSCLCRDITFEVSGTPQSVAACHCGQCRKQSGHFWASAAVPQADLAITGTSAWFEASDTAKRGFCSRCGSFLFWKAHDEDTISFALGALDGPTGLRLTRHIFCDDKGDYYQIEQGAAQHAQS
ncbi:aldehyde-activating protein [Pelagivirga sediminicola]|uniref:Aldehyde-activating protein n=1 Tax=Pelagivirga sediminicola TaxID=2170575 RepID=A0A2T7G5S5_9RHOB|nr:GFA family protein [Pelagivirga sediminicola]PVA09771.1 aldehyde-activating protein [Pelagivirga sediminicola]